MKMEITFIDCIKIGIGIYIGWTLACNVHKKIKED